jgi:hypothetical protein
MQALSTSREDSCRTGLGGILAGLFARNRDGYKPASAPRQPENAGWAGATGAEDRAGLAERHYPIRIRLSRPAGSHSLDQIHAWLTDRCGPHGWAMATTGVGRDHSLALYLLDPMLAGEFVARWCAADRIEAAEGALRIRDAALPIQLAGRRPKKPQLMVPRLASAA